MMTNEEITGAPAVEAHQMAGRKGKVVDGSDAELATTVDATADPKDNRIVDAVWGTIEEGGPNYRNLSWIKATVLEVKTQIGLGILGLPAVLSVLGFVPGIITIVVVAIIITWSDYVVGAFKLRHPEVYTVADVGQLMFGPIGRELLGFAYWIEVVATAGAGFLSISVAFNTITEHATCTVAWAVLGAVIVGVISSIQTLDRISWLGWVGLVSILSAVITLTVAVGVSDRPSLAPEGDFTIITEAVGSPTFLQAMSSVSVVVFAYAGTPNFFAFVAEMRDPKDFTFSVIASQTFITTAYLVIACTVYHYVGQYIASPALGSAGLLIKKICYGLAIPGLIIGAVLFAHVAAKYVFVRVLHKSRHLAKNTPVHYMVWYGCVGLTCAIGFIIAESIPFFNDLLSLIGALLATVICIQMEAYMWMWDHWRDERTTKWKLLMLMNVVFFAVGMFVMITGTWGAVKTIHENLQNGNTTSPFSCADNSGN